MEQYINKSAVVAEIERRLKALNKDRDFNYLQVKELEALLSFLDTLETKAVDLEEVVDDAKDLAMRDMAWNVHVMISEGKSISEIDHYVCGICDF